MKVMAIQQYGGPEVLEPLELPVPEPGAGEVRVKVHAVSINPVDFRARRQDYLGYTDFPVVLGWDISGVVDALGSDVTDFKVGDEVYGMIHFPEQGRAYAEYVTAPVAEIALKPQRLSHVEAAATTLAALTALQNLDEMKLQKEQTILIHAGSGGVGHFAVQLAKARGAKVVATASGKNRDFVLGLGADEFVDYREQRFEDVVKDVDAVLDTVGGDTLIRSFRVVKPGGWVVSIVTQMTDELTEQAKQAGINAVWNVVHPSKADLEQLSTLAQSGQLEPHISQTFPLERVADAHRAQESGHAVGKLVLTVA